MCNSDPEAKSGYDKNIFPKCWSNKKCSKKPEDPRCPLKKEAKCYPGKDYTEEKTKAFSSEGITLKQFLNLSKEHKILLEDKCSKKDEESCIILRNSISKIMVENRELGVIFQSFNDKSIKYFKERGFETIKLLSTKRNLKKEFTGISFLKYKNIGFDQKFLFFPNIVILIFIRSFIGCLNHIWTVDSYPVYFLSDLVGENGIFTDRIDKLLRYKKIRKPIHFVTHSLLLYSVNKKKIDSFLKDRFFSKIFRKKIKRKKVLFSITTIVIVLFLLDTKLM